MVPIIDDTSDLTDERDESDECETRFLRGRRRLMTGVSMPVGVWDTDESSATLIAVIFSRSAGIHPGGEKN